MKPQFKFASITFSVAAAMFLFGSFAAGPSSAQQGVTAPFFTYENGPSGRQGPDGTYEDEADFISDIRGRPCDMACTKRLQERWAAYYAQQHVYYHPGRHRPHRPVQALY